MQACLCVENDGAWLYLFVAFACCTWGREACAISSIGTEYRATSCTSRIEKRPLMRAWSFGGNGTSCCDNSIGVYTSPETANEEEEGLPVASTGASISTSMAPLFRFLLWMVMRGLPTKSMEKKEKRRNGERLWVRDHTSKVLARQSCNVYLLSSLLCRQQRRAGREWQRAKIEITKRKNGWM